MRYTIRSIHLSRQRADKPGEAAERVRSRLAGEQAHREALERFGPVTVENFHEFAKWQDSRMRELCRQYDDLCS